jgi:3-methyladenine DNA glycosylase Tag
MEVDKDEYTLEISNLVRERQKVESAANAAKKAEATAKKKLVEAAS